MTVDMEQLKEDFNLAMNHYECTMEEAQHEKEKLMKDLEGIAPSWHDIAKRIREDKL